MKVRTGQKTVLRSNKSEQDSLSSAPWDDNIPLLFEKKRAKTHIKYFCVLSSDL